MSTAELEQYLSRPMTPPAGEVLEAIARGPIDPVDALGRRSLDRLLDPSSLRAETGWCTLPDGVAYAAVRTEMPGVTGDMVDWWFDWHQRDPSRYRLWFPGAHRSISFEPAPAPAAKPFWGAVHHPVEDIGIGMERLRIAFQPPTRLGFSTDALDDQRVATIVGGFVGDDRRRAQHTVMAHVFLARPEGVVGRSRFWIGAALRPYAPAPVAGAATPLINRRFVRARLIPRRTARAMAEHCAAEYANLAALLPELHARYADDHRTASPSEPA
jgi:phloretin hydrolase